VKSLLPNHHQPSLSSQLFDKGVELVTHVKKNMTAKLISVWDRAILSRRFIIETINDQLKNITQIEHSRHMFVLYQIDCYLTLIH